jgi:hypothetical protein
VDEQETPLVGTWIHPRGTKMEITRDDEGVWHAAAYLFRGGKTPVGGGPLSSDPGEVQEKIRGLEAEGWVRVEPGEPGPPKAPMAPLQIAGAVLVAIGILVAVVLLLTLIR